MPTISVFYGIVIRMRWGDHAPPHRHAIYGNHEALFDIRSLEVIRGSLPQRAASLTAQWAEMHREELLENWELCAKKKAPRIISPLEEAQPFPGGSLKSSRWLGTASPFASPTVARGSRPVSPNRK